MKHMTSKIENLKDIEYYSNFESLSNILLGWSKKKENKELDECIRAMTQIAFYVNELQSDRWARKKAVSDYRADKLRAVERARKADELADSLQQENSKLQKIVNL